jgi:hypothetical protein
MNSKAAKKQRQFLRREFKKEYQEKARAIAARDMNMFRPRPRFFPEWLWIKILSYFIKIKKTK